MNPERGTDMYGMYETKPLLIIGIITAEKFTNIYMEEVFKRDYQVYCIQCMQIKPCQYVGDNYRPCYVF